MRALILAAGYATRLYPLTLNKAKPLLPVGGRPAIEHIVAKLEGLKSLTKLLIVTNNKFYKQFAIWKKKNKSKIPIKIINDRTLSDADKLGAIGDMGFVLNKEGLNQHLLVIAGDNLFEGALDKFVKFATTKIPASTVGLHEFKDLRSVKRYSQVKLNRAARVVEFIEKPKKPTSTLVAKCLYFFPKQKLALINKYINSGKNKDAPGYYISWLSRVDKVYGFVFSDKWYDIGNLKVYRQADKEFSKT
jgi:glucose-1-phosphate thymidylyltransferase